MERGSKGRPKGSYCQPQALAVGTYSVTGQFYASLQGMGAEDEIQPWPQVLDSESLGLLGGEVLPIASISPGCSGKPQPHGPFPL